MSVLQLSCLFFPSGFSILNSLLKRLYESGAISIGMYKKRSVVPVGNYMEGLFHRKSSENRNIFRGIPPLSLLSK